MATLTITPTNNCVALTGGVTAAAGTPAESQLFVGGVWVNGDEYSVNVLDTATGFNTQIGAGNATGIQPVQLLTFANKIYALAGSAVYFCGVAQPTVWNDPNGTFNGFVALTNYYASNENLVAIAPYQGRLAFFSRWTVQIFEIDENPANWQQAQVLPNMGTLATNSVQSLGDLDVLFLNDTGVRSLRVRDSSLYAFINDMGSPIDTLIQSSLAANTLTANASACGVVDPESGRYWLYLNGTIYVLSFYPSAKITAWGTYTPTYVSTLDSNTHTATISSFVVFQGQIYARATSDEGDLILQYGGSKGVTYDNTVATVATTWLDVGKPSIRKTAKGFDGALSVGETTTWNISAGMNPTSGTLDTVIKATQSTFLNGQIPYSADGFHFQIKAVSNGTGPAILSSLIFEYELNEEK